MYEAGSTQTEAYLGVKDDDFNNASFARCLSGHCGKRRLHRIERLRSGQYQEGREDWCDAMKKPKAFNTDRTTISITPSVYAKAQEVMRLRDFTKFSTFIQQLIREEWERKTRNPTSPDAARSIEPDESEPTQRGSGQRRN